MTESASQMTPQELAAYNQAVAMAFLIAGGCLMSCYFLFRIQCEISAARTRINEVKREFFQTKKETFGKLYNNPFCRDAVYPGMFAIMILLTGAFVIFSFLST